MEINSLLALSSVLALSLPLVVIVATGLYKHRSFPALCIYYLCMIFDNSATEGYLLIDENISQLLTALTHLIEPLLILGFLTHFSRSVFTKKRIQLIIACLAIFEVYSIAMLGFNESGLLTAFGPSIITVLCLSIYFFRHQAKLSINKGKAIGKAVILAAFIYMYGSYFICYLLYFILSIQDIASSHSVLYFINIFSSSFIAIGALLESYRVRKIQELLIVRKEIAAVYSLS